MKIIDHQNGHPVQSPNGLTCDLCRHWVATSKEQFARRQTNRSLHPQVKVHACPTCGSQDWASMLIEEAPPPSFWKKLMARIWR